MRPSSMVDEFEDEMSGLRFRLRRLYAILRHVSRAPPDLNLVETALRELIRDAEKRLDVLETSSLTQSAERRLLATVRRQLR